jgi:hypothetical protein
MVDWFGVINIWNIFLLLLGFLIGRFWRLGKRFIEFISQEKNGEDKSKKV